MTPLPSKTIPTEPLPDFKAVLWDVDGTLVDSEPLHFASVQVVGVEIDCPVPNELLMRSVGVSHLHCFKSLQSHLNMPISFDTWKMRVENAYLDLAAKILPRENVVDIVRTLHARGIPQGVFSNSPGKIVRANITGFLRFFDNPCSIFSHVVSIDDVSNGKPDPEGYFVLAQKMGLGTDQCLVIEDSPTGLRAGIAAGCSTIFWPQMDHGDLLVKPHVTTRDLGALFL
jgi:HAD superfamily hydrolase (TIGR01509 family)